ncbi:MAG TPA: hypothetical protein VMR70_14495 [Flavisolibacter sp.]|nr:hypothetical protein [Flavisolibacter sp.]
MNAGFNTASLTTHVRHLQMDLSDCSTWSFPEFIPFCSHLYYFSSFKLYYKAPSIN